LRKKKTDFLVKQLLCTIVGGSMFCTWMFSCH